VVAFSCLTQHGLPWRSSPLLRHRLNGEHTLTPQLPIIARLPSQTSCYGRAEGLSVLGPTNCRPRAGAPPSAAPCGLLGKGLIDLLLGELDADARPLLLQELGRGEVPVPPPTLDRFGQLVEGEPREPHRHV
jgi:hypothetical protein